MTQVEIERETPSQSCRPHVEGFHDASSGTISYLVTDPQSRHAAVIDPVLDYEPRSGRTATRSLEPLMQQIDARGLTLDWILETHPHADHLSGAPLLKERCGGRIGIGRGVTSVQDTWSRLFNLGPEFPCDGSQFDRLFDEGDSFTIGGLEARVWETPGHTPACITYLIDDAAFIGDTLFMPDSGSARADFPGGDAAQLYRSIQRILALPDDTRLFVCHDYQPGGRNLAYETTVALQKAANTHVGSRKSEADYVRLRQERDAQLDLPELLLPSLQVNIRAGHLPPSEDDGQRYLKIPLNRL